MHWAPIDSIYIAHASVVQKKKTHRHNCGCHRGSALYSQSECVFFWTMLNAYQHNCVILEGKPFFPKTNPNACWKNVRKIKGPVARLSGLPAMAIHKICNNFGAIRSNEVSKIGTSGNARSDHSIFKATSKKTSSTILWQMEALVTGSCEGGARNPTSMDKLSAWLQGWRVR